MWKFIHKLLSNVYRHHTSFKKILIQGNTRKGIHAIICPQGSPGKHLIIYFGDAI
jgi:hypothetical protein